MMVGGDTDEVNGVYCGPSWTAGGVP